ncbi:hypothetical protein GCM10010302_39380 [Streptomyces polychromogenes]|uniref:Uncharacterized protein n=1 Tax=Streptomyces polychromogenes TaxID=67342 RepID=A0ABN0VFS5_9ACTN
MAAPVQFREVTAVWFSVLDASVPNPASGTLAGPTDTAAGCPRSGLILEAGRKDPGGGAERTRPTGRRPEPRETGSLTDRFRMS